jgi:2-(1,2-epoxy-1,2-dihydrophenyl)acetyl-CoA isomerase
MYKEIIYKSEASLAVITLNKPDKLNAYSPDMGDEIIDAYRKAALDSQIKSIAITGNGRGFCAGADKDYLINGKVSKKGIKLGDDEFIVSFAKELADSPKVLIAAINGLAVGIGVTMTLPFDIRIASVNANFSFPFTQLGILPGLGSSHYLTNLVGLSKAKELILTGANIDAKEAHFLGLVNMLSSEEDLLDDLVAIAENIDKSTLSVLSLAKESLNFGYGVTVDEAMNKERELINKISDIS